MKKLRDENGQVIVLAALCMTVLLGMVAFATDVGLLFRSKEIMQTAADSAALAGAAEISYGDMTVAARADAAQNGITDGVNGAIVTVNSPPLSGPNAGSAGYVEVIVSQPQPTVFMKIFYKNPVTVGARAVAAAPPVPSCIETLNPNPTTSGKKGPVSAPGISLSGSASLSLPNCGITDGANNSVALSVSGGGSGGAWITTPYLGVVGSVSYGNGVSTNLPATPITGIAAPADPFASTVLPPPASDYASGCLTQSISGPTPVTITMPSSGYICFNSLSETKGGAPITLQPGLYIFNGAGGAGSKALDMESSVVMTGSGVTLYFVNGASFTFDRGATANLSAPTAPGTAGDYTGILFYQDATDSADASFVGGSQGSLNGIFYLPGANLDLANGASATFNTNLVVGSLAMSGAATLNPYTPLSGSGSTSSARLAE